MGSFVGIFQLSCVACVSFANSVVASTLKEYANLTDPQKESSSLSPLHIFKYLCVHWNTIKIECGDIPKPRIGKE